MIEGNAVMSLALECGWLLFVREFIDERCDTVWIRGIKAIRMTEFNKIPQPLPVEISRGSRDLFPREFSLKSLRQFRRQIDHLELSSLCSMIHFVMLYS
jgi:hypothetical protein